MPSSAFNASNTALDFAGLDSTTRDIAVNLYLTNAAELTPCLKYLILEVGIYEESHDGTWQKAAAGGDDRLPADAFVTLRSSQLSFVLAGDARYKITIDSGSFYCMTTGTKYGDLSPKFYLTIEPAQVSSPARDK